MSLVLRLAMMLLALTGSALADDSEQLREIVQLVRTHGLSEPPPSASTAASESELLTILRTTDPYVAIEPPAAAGPAGAGGESRGLGLRVSTLGAAPAALAYLDSPAGRAGLAEPAWLVALGGKPVTAQQPAIPLPATGTVPVEVRRARRPAAIFDIEVGTYQPRSVELIANRPWPIVRIHELALEETARDLHALLPRLAAAEGLVLDLRFNPGGSMYEALDAASLFLPASYPLATTRDRDGREQLLRAISWPRKELRLPLLLLVSDHTVSAAEVFTRPLLTYRRAVAIGQPTFGKCRSQRYLPLKDGRRLVVSNLAVLDPGGEDCDRQPIRPDVLVESDAILDTTALIERGRQLLGGAQRPTALCLDEKLEPSVINDRLADLPLFFSQLPTPPFPRPNGAGFRRCIGPFETPADLSAWKLRLEGKLEKGKAQRVDEFSMRELMALD